MRYWVHHSLQAIKRPFSAASRQARAKAFIELMEIKGGERIIDLGGMPKFWSDIPVPLHITVLNLPGSRFEVPQGTLHTFEFLEGDACQVTAFEDMSFDLVFSNSVIEHVGPEEKQAEMAREVKRLAPRYWVQTPSIWFPVEAHTNMPFWWFWPEALKQATIRNWRRKLPAWTEMVEGTRVLLRSQLQALFPDGRIWTERRLGITKSYVVYKRHA